MLKIFKKSLIIVPIVTVLTTSISCEYNKYINNKDTEEIIANLNDGKSQLIADENGNFNTLTNFRTSTISNILTTKSLVKRFWWWNLNPMGVLGQKYEELNVSNNPNFKIDENYWIKERENNSQIIFGEVNTFKINSKSKKELAYSPVKLKKMINLTPLIVNSNEIYALASNDIFNFIPNILQANARIPIKEKIEFYNFKTKKMEEINERFVIELIEIKNQFSNKQIVLKIDFYTNELNLNEVIKPLKLNLLTDKYSSKFNLNNGLENKEIDFKKIFTYNYLWDQKLERIDAIRPTQYNKWEEAFIELKEERKLDFDIFLTSWMFKNDSIPFYISGLFTKENKTKINNFISDLDNKIKSGEFVLPATKKEFINSDLFIEFMKTLIPDKLGFWRASINKDLKIYTFREYFPFLDLSENSTETILKEKLAFNKRQLLPVDYYKNLGNVVYRIQDDEKIPYLIVNYANSYIDRLSTKEKQAIKKLKFDKTFSIAEAIDSKIIEFVNNFN
ncbi:hypothetical protein [Mycoplasmopsis gallinarum]|uniref:Lipoprotein n=1 Tax=Mycoplasmopsis gallinarum TaxID=29557 RepID=A0A168RRH7_9BACT|nr:hypothetical protein [Mycoplasmopsis gallinarum]OAB49216.1 hypothetical protein MGALLINA_00110 [Mycoplasmopsis gallinarum]